MSNGNPNLIPIEKDKKNIDLEESDLPDRIHRDALRILEEVVKCKSRKVR